uniref:RING-type domain-containing protein n=1 Tax=Gallus gallus TaxID=9031 RepID=A0A8V1AGP2_CHICK
ISSFFALWLPPSSTRLPLQKPLGSWLTTTALNALCIRPCLRASGHSCQNARKIKLYTYRQGDQYETCVICMSEYKEGDLLKILPCSHTYHHLCIDTWFDTQSRKKTCPFCKQQVNVRRQADLLSDRCSQQEPFPSLTNHSTERK